MLTDEEHLPHTSAADKKAFLIQPSFGAAKRVFLLLNNLLVQKTIEAAITLQITHYNNIFLRT